MSILCRYARVSSKEDSDVRQTSGSTGSRSAEVILHSSESSSEPISGSDEVVGLLEECGHDEANAPDSPSPTTSPVTCTRIVPLKPNQPRLKFPMRQFGSKRRSCIKRSNCYSWYEKYTAGCITLKKKMPSYASIALLQSS